MLVSQTPGGLYEHFFVEVGTKAVDGEAGRSSWRISQTWRGS